MKLTTRTVLLTTGVVAMIGAPASAIGAGEGKPVRGGARSPSPDTRKAYTRETEVIANTSTYGTRQSNKSDNGGGAIYGCRSKAGGTPAKNEPCLRATNLVAGLAFEFSSNTGVLGGTINVGNGGDETKPFTTNATGVATGLNADRVDGKSAEDLANADKLDGLEGAQYVAKTELLFARVTAAGAVEGGRGATAATMDEATNTATVTFDRDINACALTATLSGTTADPDRTFVASATAARVVTVDQSQDGAAALPFHLQVTC